MKKTTKTTTKLCNHHDCTQLWSQDVFRKCIFILQSITNTDYPLFFYNQLSCYVWNRCILLCMFKIFQDWGWRMVTVHLDSSIKINMLSYTWIKYPSPSHSNGVFHQTVLKQYRTVIKKGLQSGWLLWICFWQVKMVPFQSKKERNSKTNNKLFVINVPAKWINVSVM